MSAQKPREIAVQILRRQGTSAFIEDLFDAELARRPLSSADRGLCQELVFGVVRWQRALDWLIDRKTNGRAQTAVLQILLRLGLYQLFWLDRIPDHAAVHETVELAKRLGFGPKAGFLNAILRGYIRERDQTAQELAALKISQPAIGQSHPDWLVERWQAKWGRDQTNQLLQWNNTVPPTYARVNTPKGDAARLMAQWSAEGVTFASRSFPWVEENVVFELLSHPPLAKLPSFVEGRFYIQDPSTLLAVRELSPQPGERILDLCAAPGGKTTFMAQRMQNQGRILALDLHLGRLKLLEENCARLGAACVQTGMAVLDSGGEGLFDRILIDAPCSNTGVLRRRVELRWRVTLAEMERLRRTQLELLAAAAPKLKPGGVMAYSTCSLEAEENEMVVADFLRERPEFALQSERRLLPFLDGTDGAYVARLALV
ncbi:MAG TPA: 16S rRNA (cytosine(967)-C(5))-methyltransferase RsmB [Verrucomicrobiae bacterium]|nr:16S rRNA (cytosine(967)-C(5))-methyltransferase RsmB [Verrucomicrobiae bacterium]